MSGGAVLGIVLLAVLVNWLLTMWAVAIGVRSALRWGLDERLLAPSDAAKRRDAAARYASRKQPLLAPAERQRRINEAAEQRRSYAEAADAKRAARRARRQAKRETGEK